MREKDILGQVGLLLEVLVHAQVSKVLHVGGNLGQGLLGAKKINLEKRSCTITHGRDQLSASESATGLEIKKKEEDNWVKVLEGVQLVALAESGREP